VHFVDRPGFTNNVGLSIGQSIFTPEDTDEDDLIRDDRPYAGWLYGAVSLHHKSRAVLHFLEIQAGIVGPYAFGEEAQNGVHKLRGLHEAEGWEHQLETEPGLIVTYEQKRRMPAWEDSGLNADLIPGVRVSLGNVLTEAAAGATVRLGHNLPRDFHGNRIRSSGYALPPTQPGEANAWNGPVRFYVFAGAEGRYVAQDIFLDGNTLRDSHSVDREPFVAEMEAGAGIGHGDWRLTYTHVWLTRQFKGQRGTYHTYGAISLSILF
jgi:hypothetical protein